MIDKICTSGHVMNDSDVVCGRCGSSAQLSNNNSNTMENEENKVVENGAVETPAVEEKLEGETVAVESAPEVPADSEVKDESTDSPEASEEAPAVDSAPASEESPAE